MTIKKMTKKMTKKKQLKIALELLRLRDAYMELKDDYDLLEEARDELLNEHLASLKENSMLLQVMLGLVNGDIQPSEINKYYPIAEHLKESQLRLVKLSPQEPDVELDTESDLESDD